MQPKLSIKAKPKRKAKSEASSDAKAQKVTARFKLKLCERCLFWVQKRKPSAQKITRRFK
jgi:hypothetical protein